MKKAFFIIIIFAFLFCLSSCNKDNTPATPLNLTSYNLDITIDQEGNQANVKQIVKYTNAESSTLGELYFHLYANSYRKESSNPAYEKPLNAYGSIDIISLKVNDASSPITYMNDGALLKVLLPVPLKALSSATIEIDYIVKIPNAPLRLGRYDRTINMGNFYPVLAVYENNMYRLDKFTHIGDPFYSDIANYDVKIKCGRDYVVASSGKILSDVKSDLTKTVIISQNNIRDFAFVMSRDFLVKSKTIDDTVVSYYYYLDTQADRGLDIAVSALSTFSEAYGKYPYETYTVVETSFAYGGMEYPTLSFINAQIKDKEEVIIHETAHQWFACMIGSDSIKQPYIDEGLATFSTMFYYKLNGNDEKYNKMLKNIRNAYISFIMIEQANKPGYEPMLKRSLYDYRSSYEYEMLCYNKSAIMFNALFEALGEEKFKKAMHNYYLNECYKISNLNALITSLSTKHFSATNIIMPFIEGDVVITSFKV